MIIECRHCGKNIDMDSSYAGKMILCPHCRKKVIAGDKRDLERYSSEKKVVKLVKMKEKKHATLADWFRAHMKVFLINVLIQTALLVYMASIINEFFGLSGRFIPASIITSIMTAEMVSIIVVSVLTSLITTFLLPYMTVLMIIGTFIYLLVLFVVKDAGLLAFLMMVIYCAESIYLSCITARRFNANNMPGELIVSLHTIFFFIALFLCPPLVLVTTICLLLILIFKKGKIETTPNN